MSMMAARIVVLRIVSPIIPAIETDAVERLWLVGSNRWREYRLPATGAPVAVQFITTATVGGTAYALCVFWGLGGDRATPDAATYAGLLNWLQTNGYLVASWPTNLDASGNLLTAAIDADAGVAATNVKAVWPSAWHLYQPSDWIGYVMGNPAPSPTGARCVAEWAA